MRHRPLRYVAVTVVCATISMTCSKSPTDRFTQKIPEAKKVVLLEGLPHQFYESELLASESRNKSTIEIDGFPFYEEPLPISEEDTRQLTKVLSKPETLLPFRGEKKCGGFHPDYAVEWYVDDQKQTALICFGCGEIVILNHDGKSRHDLDSETKQKLRTLLERYEKNRPRNKSPEMLNGYRQNQKD